MIYEHIKFRESINNGWSGDKKYRIRDDAGNTYLLRISPTEQLERKRDQFERMKRVSQLGIPMCLPIEFGICAEGVYSIQSWIDGQDAEDVMRSLPMERQYAYGYDAGEILRKIHSIPAPEGRESWSAYYNRKIDRKLAMYDSCPLKYEHGELFLNHIAANRHLLSNRAQTYQHGDYHIGNMMTDRTGKLIIIDFEKDDYGDPWEEFNRIVWCGQKAPHFAAGLVDGYFSSQVPQDFWEILALYISTSAIGSLPWAIPFGEEEITTMRNQAGDILGWYDNMRTVIPSWYRK